MSWSQYRLKLQSRPRGIHLITEEIRRAITELSRVRIGVVHIFIRHTSASLSINENASPDVRRDLERSLNRIVPEDDRLYEHTLEGLDDMPAHVKASLMGASLTIPVANGQLLLGTWQGVYLCEHRNHGCPREIVITLSGEIDRD